MSVCLYNATQVLCPLTWRSSSVPFNVGSISKIFLTYVASQISKGWGSMSPMTAGISTIWHKPKMERSNLTRMKWVYHTFTPTTHRMWTFYKPSRNILKSSPRNRSPQPNSLVNPRELLVIYMRETSNPW